MTRQIVGSDGGQPLTHYNREAFWGGDERGYLDFSTYAEGVAA